MHSTTSRRQRSLALGVLASTAGVLLLAGPGGSAEAAAPAKVTVTIKAEGTDLSGTVLSARRACKDNRTVVVYKQIGTRGGGDDVRFASDTTEVSGGVGQWNTGNTGTEGRFYAKLKKTTQCLGDTSPTIRAVRKP